MATKPKFKFFLALYRTFALVFSTVILLLCHLPSVLRKDVKMSIVKSWHAMMCRYSGIDVTVKGEVHTGQHIMYVSNHVSYIDIPIMGSVLEAWFVAKSEVKGWPAFGYLSELGKTVFIERKSRRAATQRNQLADILLSGKNLILFPEGTSSDGLDVVNFKPTLFEAAYGEGIDDVMVQPFSITYDSVDNVPLDTELRDRYAWYGDMTLADHFWYWLGIGQLQATLVFHDPVSAGQFADRKEMAKHCEEQIRQGLKHL